jgi:hypothetical protein
VSPLLLLLMLDMLNMEPGPLRWPLVLLFSSNTVLYPSFLPLSLLVLFCLLNELENG